MAATPTPKSDAATAIAGTWSKRRVTHVPMIAPSTRMTALTVRIFCRIDTFFTLRAMISLDHPIRSRSLPQTPYTTDSFSASTTDLRNPRSSDGAAGSLKGIHRQPYRRRFSRWRGSRHRVLARA